ncbi:hypothetical protein BC826DRAFT_971770 [Russula brevipes]|nr:hypothetical protein BC826DRAFT_971770 [Russula brevipes]
MALVPSMWVFWYPSPTQGIPQYVVCEQFLHYGVSGRVGGRDQYTVPPPEGHAPKQKREVACAGSEGLPARGIETYRVTAGAEPPTHAFVDNREERGEAHTARQDRSEWEWRGAGGGSERRDTGVIMSGGVSTVERPTTGKESSAPRAGGDGYELSSLKRPIDKA